MNTKDQRSFLRELHSAQNRAVFLLVEQFQNTIETVVLP